MNTQVLLPLKWLLIAIDILVRLLERSSGNKLGRTQPLMWLRWGIFADHDCYLWLDWCAREEALLQGTLAFGPSER
jgi:hypothetical protein